MKFKYLFYAFTVVVFSSCKNQEKFPEVVTEKVDRENVKIVGDLPRGNTFHTEIKKEESLPESLLRFKQQYAQRSETFDLNLFQQEWQIFKEKNDIRKLDKQSLKSWFDVTGFLLQLTGGETFAAELE
ncbi:MAG: hypothetical protein ACP5D9_17995, partial [Mariniphaga sp.]